MSKTNDLLRGHVSLEVECLDRIYLNGYIPTVQILGQLTSFPIEHPTKQKVLSPALLHQMTQKPLQDVKQYNRLFWNDE